LSADLCDGDGGHSGGAPDRQILEVVWRSMAVDILCVIFWRTVAAGHREGTEINPGGRGMELCAWFPWPPGWVLFFYVEK